MECFVEGSVDDDVRVCHAGLSVNENDEVWYHSLMCDSFYCHRHLFKSMLNILVIYCNCSYNVFGCQTGG